MFKVEQVEDRGGRGMVAVRRDGRLVSSASIGFVQWMHDRVPNEQLCAAQIALVNWYEKQDIIVQPTSPGRRI